MDNNINNWLEQQFNVNFETIIRAVQLSHSAQGYIHGAVSELLLIEHLYKNNFEVKRIKEKPSGGFDEKKVGYKGDFLINKKGENVFYVIECKGLKTNSEFRYAETDSIHEKNITRKQAFNFLKKFININKQKIYEKGLQKYNNAKNKWEIKNSKKQFPLFRWNKDIPGPDNVDLSKYFKSNKELNDFIKHSDINLLKEEAFRHRCGLYKVLQTHKPSQRIDPITGIKQTAPLISDFSILAVDLFLRTGKHEFVFMNPETISHSPTSPNHLYQNYIIDILIPGIKDNLDIKYPWFDDINKCIELTNPKCVEFDPSQIDYRDI